MLKKVGNGSGCVNQISTNVSYNITDCLHSSWASKLYRYIIKLKLLEDVRPIPKSMTTGHMRRSLYRGTPTYVGSERKRFVHGAAAPEVQRV